MVTPPGDSTPAPLTSGGKVGWVAVVAISGFILIYWERYIDRTNKKIADLERVAIEQTEAVSIVVSTVGAISVQQMDNNLLIADHENRITDIEMRKRAPL